ncbi:hypothetical protein QJS10_CPA01g01848 [Acorus calamus]|uniref:DUF676 domain-containing protein n=1 Tax=Acorus calamus TaxID=4465 RepID=A0AAV9FJA8_ACOCL|nr:hypothetical protein QJS10_CPA01g01848 [Acorus calamus]
MGPYPSPIVKPCLLDQSWFEEAEKESGLLYHLVPINEDEFLHLDAEHFKQYHSPGASPQAERIDEDYHPLNNGQLDDLTSSTNDGSVKPACNPQLGKIAGLEPVNFITLATPHLGVRGKNQLPFLLGDPILEKLAPPIAPFIIGRTGRQLFLTDGKPSRPPLLLRMTSDCED